MKWLVQAKRALPMVLCLALSSPATAIAQEEQRRSFSGSGSVGSDSSIELYLLDAEYTHRLEADGSCDITAGVFPAHRQPAVRVSEVLQADLAVLRQGATARAGPDGVFTITQPGWATVQVGTGPDCTWTYEIAGPFLPAGREPRPPGALEQPWVLWTLVFGGLALLVGPFLRRRVTVRGGGDDGDGRVTVLDVEAAGADRP